MIIEGLIIGGIAKGLYEINKSCNIDQKTYEKQLKTSEKLAKAQAVIQKHQKSADDALSKVANRKRAILSTSMNSFLNTYERIMKINFNESDGIRELKSNMLVPTEVTNLRAEVKTSLQPLSDKEIALRWIFRGFTNTMVKDSERKLSIANSQLKAAMVVESQAETISLALSAVEERSNKIAELLAKLNALFVKSIKYTNEIIDNNGCDGNAYNKHEKDSIMSCINLAGAIKDIIDTPLLDNDGKITKASQEAISRGNEYLNALSNI